MFEAISSLFQLTWRQQPPQFRPLSSHIERILVPSAEGDLELLVCSPDRPDANAVPIFFVHGGYGSAGVWLEWMTYLHEAGYSGTTYAYSARNHGASYSLPFVQMVFRTTIDDIAADFRSCFEFASKREQAAARSNEPVLVGHSSGGGLSQYALDKGLVQCRALCLLDAVPHFGMLPVYANWLRHDPWFPLRNLIHWHPTSPLSSPNLVLDAFFGSRFPRSKTAKFMRWMPGYESMGWPTSMMGSVSAWWRGSCRWLNVDVILGNVSSASNGLARDSICIIIGDQDKLMDVAMCQQQAAEYRQGLAKMWDSACATEAAATPTALRRDSSSTASADGVRLVIVEGAGHHLQNDVQRGIGAQALLRFVRQC